MFNPVEKILELRTRLQTENEQYLFAATSYFLFLSLVVLWLKHDDEFIKFHAKQGFILFILVILVTPLWLLPKVWGLSFGWVPNLFVALIIVIGVFKALDGKLYNIPIITPLAKSIPV